MSKKHPLDIVAIVVSACALFATGYQAYLSRDHNRKSVRPVVTLFYSDSLMSDLRVAVESHGLGPAWIKQTNLYLFNKEIRELPTYKEYDNYRIASGMEGIINTDSIFSEKIMNNVSLPDPGDVISSNDLYSTIQVNNEIFRKLSEEETITLICDLPRHLIIEIEYCSSYEDCWTVSSLNQSLHPVCPYYNGKPHSSPDIREFVNRASDA